jgi:serine/threonine-protein kinase
VRLRVVLDDSRGWLGLRRAAVGCAWLVSGVGLFLFVFAAAFYFAMRVEMRATEVRLPDLTGLTLEAASQKVQPLELVLLVADQRHDPAVPSGRVLQQSPPGGTSVRRGRKVKLVMSLGGRVLSVPNLVGQAARAVEIDLRQQGLVPGYEVRVPAAAAAGTVLAQVPPADTPTVPNTRVHRLVSDGPAERVWVMPDLTGRSGPEAERWIERSGFRVSLRRVTIAGRESGSVVGQLPLAGYPVRTNQIVELTVAQ